MNRIAAHLALGCPLPSRGALLLFQAMLLGKRLL
jgi:hypothetical protein